MQTQYDCYADWDATKDYFAVAARNGVPVCRLQAGGTEHGITPAQVEPLSFSPGLREISGLVE